MTNFRIDVGQASVEIAPSTIDALKQTTAARAETEFLGAWQGPEGDEHLAIRGSSQEQVQDVVQEAGLTVSAVMRVPDSEPLVPAYPNMFPGAKLWCTVHHAYHEPPACGSL